MIFAISDERSAGLKSWAQTTKTLFSAPHLAATLNIAYVSLFPAFTFINSQNLGPKIPIPPLS